MLGTEERTGLDVFEMLALDVSLDEEQPCEHYAHKTEFWWHGGVGEWYMKYDCPKCPWVGEVFLYCDRFKKELESVGACCPKCKAHSPFAGSFIIVERK